MDQISTRYGILKGITSAEHYPDGRIAECTLNLCNKILTPWGELIPQYGDDGARRKYTRSLSFHPNGSLKSISLHEQTLIPTPVGILPAELVTFYENEKICRIFPLNGKLTGFWNEANEYELARELQFKLTLGEFKQKIISLHFYESGAIQSFTFWPKDSLIIPSPIGNVPIRIGFSLYPDGSLESFEPLRPLPVNTPIGRIMAYDTNADGISGDHNSVIFTPLGELESLVTSGDRIILNNRNGRHLTFAAGLAPNICDDQKMEPVPLYIAFTKDRIQFGKESGVLYEREQFQFTIQSGSIEVERFCDECSGYAEG